MIAYSANWTERQKAAFTTEQLESLRAFTVRGLWLLNLVTMLMLTHVNVNSLQTALGLRPGLGPAIWVYFAAIMGIGFWMVVKTLSFRPGKPDDINERISPTLACGHHGRLLPARRPGLVGRLA